MRLVVGLGNPGKKYEQTRHNVGFLVVQALSEYFSRSLKKENDLFEVAHVSEEHTDVILVKPSLFMNESGRAVKAVMDQYRVRAGQCLVVVDDVGLPIGKIRFRKQGSSGGHNGLASVISVLGTKNVPRLRIGIGPYLGPSEQLPDFVLAKFPKEDRKEIECALRRAQEACLEWLKSSADEVMQKFN